MINKNSKKLVALLVSLGLLGVACGDSSDGPSAEDSASTATEVSGAMAVSADGILTLIQAGEAVAITIDELEDGGLAIDDTVPLHSYELGPDGTSFDTPVEIRVSVTSQDLASGVAVVLESSDGSIESIDTELVKKGEQNYLVGEIDHFSRIRIVRLDLSGVEVVLPEQMTVGGSAPLILRSTGQLIEFPTTHDQWLFVSPLALAGAEAVTCVAEGPGLAEFSGETSFEVTDSSFLQPWTIRFVANLTVVGETNCIQPKIIEYADQRCVDMLTGLKTEGCLFPSSVTVSGSDPASFQIDYAGSTEAPAVIISVFMNDEGDADPVLLERHSDGIFNGYAGPGFARFEPGEEILGGEATKTDDGFGFSFTGEFTVDELNKLIIDVEASTAGDEAIEGGSHVVTTVTIFTSTGDTQSTVLLEMSDILENWAD